MSWLFNKEKKTSRAETGIVSDEPVRILVVEDNPEISSLMAQYIENLNYVVCGTAETGEDAITLIREKRPHVVLIDVVLKGDMTGIQLADAINTEFQIPFIYTTAHSEMNMIEEVIRTKPSAFILKPFTGEELKVAIEISLRTRL